MGSTPKKHATLEQARAAKERAKVVLDRRARVVGIGLMRLSEGFGVKVNLSEALGPGVRLPDEIDGVPVKVDVTGPIRSR